MLACIRRALLCLQCCCALRGFTTLGPTNAMLPCADSQTGHSRAERKCRNCQKLTPQKPCICIESAYKLQFLSNQFLDVSAVSLDSQTSPVAALRASRGEGCVMLAASEACFPTGVAGGGSENTNADSCAGTRNRRFSTQSRPKTSW